MNEISMTVFCLLSWKSSFEAFHVRRKHTSVPQRWFCALCMEYTIEEAAEEKRKYIACIYVYHITALNTTHLNECINAERLDNRFWELISFFSIIEFCLYCLCCLFALYLCRRRRRCRCGARRRFSPLHSSQIHWIKKHTRWLEPLKPQEEQFERAHDRRKRYRKRKNEKLKSHLLSFHSSSSFWHIQRNC